MLISSEIQLKISFNANLTRVTQLNSDSLYIKRRLKCFFLRKVENFRKITGLKCDKFFIYELLYKDVNAREREKEREITQIQFERVIKRVLL